MNDFQLTLTQQYEAERMSRLIDATTDINELRAISKKLLGAWMLQKSATAWVMRQSIAAPPTIASFDP